MEKELPPGAGFNRAPLGMPGKQSDKGAGSSAGPRYTRDMHGKGSGVDSGLCEAGRIPQLSEAVLCSGQSCLRTELREATTSSLTPSLHPSVSHRLDSKPHCILAPKESPRLQNHFSHKQGFQFP